MFRMLSRHRVNGIFLVALSLFLFAAAIALVPLASASPSPQATLALPTAHLTPQATSSALAIPATQTPTAIPTMAGQTYVIQSGDTLWSIATRFYGNGSKYGLIVRANNLPDNVTLRIGSVLVIPEFTEAESPVPSKTATSVPVTPSPLPTVSPPTPVISPLPAAPQPTIAPAPSNPAEPSSNVIDPSWVPLLPYISLALNILSGLCLVGSLLCAYLSLEAYRHASPYVRRRKIGNRIRTGL